MEDRADITKKKLTQVISGAITQAFGGMLHLARGIIPERDIGLICLEVLEERTSWFKMYLAELQVPEETIEETLERAHQSGQAIWEEGKKHLERPT